MTVITLNHSHIPESIRGLLAVDNASVPRFWLTVWVALECGHLAENTLRSHLSYVDNFYKAVKEQTGKDSLDQLITDMDFSGIEACLEGYMIRLQNEATQLGIDRTKNWQCVLRFIKNIFDRLKSQESNANRLEKIHASLLRMDRLFGSLRPHKVTRPSKLRALPSEVLEELYEIIDPESSKNPFRSDRDKWRNYLLVMMYLHLGLRRSELLLLTTDSVQSDIIEETGEIINWINVTTIYEDLDTRTNKPSIKNETSHRQLPVSNELYELVLSYISNWRGKQPTPYLYTSNRKKPLSVSSVNKLFNIITQHLSQKAIKALEQNIRDPKIVPHALRHTCAVIKLSQFLDAGMDMDKALQKMRAFFGWSLESDMPRLYSRAYFESRLETVWNDRFDMHIDILRALESSKVG